MHGGFENETPNIPTNTIVKLDLLSVFKGNQILIDKLKNVVGPQGGKKEGGDSRPGSKSPTDETWSGGSKTPPS